VREIDVHPFTRLKNVDGEKTDRERDCRKNFEVNNGLDRDPANARQIPHPGYAVNHGAEDDRRDQHPDRLDERVAQRLHLCTQAGPGSAEHDPDNHSGQNLHPKLLIPGVAYLQSRRDQGAMIPPVFQ